MGYRAEVVGQLERELAGRCVRSTAAVTGAHVAAVADSSAVQVGSSLYTAQLAVSVNTTAARSCRGVSLIILHLRICAHTALCICAARRLDTSITLQVEKFHADAEERRREREAARARREAAQAARCGTRLRSCFSG